jgi:signal transduction histidine kinase
MTYYNKISPMVFGKRIVINKIALGVMVLLVVVLILSFYSILQEKDRAEQASLKELGSKAEIVDAVLLGEGEKLQIVSSIVEELTGKFIGFLDYNNIPSIAVMLQEISAKQDVDIVLFFDENRKLLATNNFKSFTADTEVYQQVCRRTSKKGGVYTLHPTVVKDFGLHLNLHENHSVFNTLTLKSTIPLIDDVGDASGYVVLLKILSCNKKWIYKLREILDTDFVFFDKKRVVLFSSFYKHDIPYPKGEQVEVADRSYISKKIPFYDSELKSLGELVLLKEDTYKMVGLKRELLKLMLPVILAMILFIATIDDTTKRRKAELELVEYQQHLEEKVKKRTLQLETANRELQDFAYIVSHDLKAPLRAISQLASWIAEDHQDTLTDDGQEQLDLLLNRVRRMHSLIEGILQYSRIGRVKETVVAIHVSDILTEVVDFIGVPDSVKVIFDSDLPIIWAERVRIFQLFQNLLSNSVKFMDKADGLILISCEEQDDFYHFSVADNGPGIKEEYFEKIFQIFQCLAPRDEYESTGIGLSLVKKIVGLYNGKVWVESIVGRGTVFHFSLDKDFVVSRPKPVEENG